MIKNNEKKQQYIVSILFYIIIYLTKTTNVYGVYFVILLLGIKEIYFTINK